MNVEIWESVCIVFNLICIKWANVSSQASSIRKAVWVRAWFKPGTSLIDVIISSNNFLLKQLLYFTKRAGANMFHFFLQIVSNGCRYKIWKCMQRIQCGNHGRKQKYGVIKYASFLIAYARFYAKRVFSICRKTIAKCFPKKWTVSRRKMDGELKSLALDPNDTWFIRM